MNKKDYWLAHVKKNPKFADESNEIRISIKMLKMLMEEGYDKGFEQGRETAGNFQDIFKDVLSKTR